MNSPIKTSKVGQLVNQWIERTEFKPSDEQKAKMRDQEPTDAQLAKLKSLGVSSDDLLQLDRYDASELIEKMVTAADQKGSITQPQIQALKGHYFKDADVADLSRNEAKDLIRQLDARRNAPR